MAPRGGDRALSEVVGFILIFTIVVLSFTVYQGIEVPNQNRQVEFNHNQQVQGQLQDLRNAILTESTAGTSQSVSIALGASYPDRTIAMNLGVSAGAIRTETYGTNSRLSINNASASGSYGETADFWNGSPQTFSSKAIVYQPVYSFYTSAPTTYYENSVVYNRFGNNVTITVTDQAIVNGRNINLIAVDGTLSRNGAGTVSVNPEALSASTSRLSVSNDSRSINVTIPTRLNASTWRDLLADEMTPEGNVTRVKQSGPNHVSILLEAGVTYNLRLANVGVGSGGQESSIRYLTLLDRPSQSIPTGSSHFIALQVRDRFDNPASGVPVTGTVTAGGGGFETTQLESDAQGQVIFNYTAPSSTTDPRLRFTIPDDSHPYERVLVNFSVYASGGGGSVCQVGSNVNSGSLQFNNLDGFAAETSPDRWRINQIDVQDPDGDADLDQLKLEIADSGGVVRGSRTIPLSGPQYQANNVQIDPDDPSYDVQTGETYTLTATVCDTDGNSLTETRQATP